MSKDPTKDFKSYVEEYGVYKKSTKESVQEYVKKENRRQRREGLIAEDQRNSIDLKAVAVPALKAWHKVMLGVGIAIIIAAIAYCIIIAN